MQRALLKNVLAVTLIWSGVVAAESTLQLNDPWARETPAGAKVGAAYLEIVNPGDADDRLVSASSDVAERTEIHTMTMEGGMMKMRQLVDGLEIPAGDRAVLKPGSHHIMFMGLKRPLQAGDEVELRLTFARDGEWKLVAPVRAMGAMEGMGGMGHGGGAMEPPGGTMKMEH